MLARTGLNAQEALVCTMVLVAASDGNLTDREIGTMAGLVQTLPVFAEFESDRLDVAADAAVALLEPRLRETAYVLACEVAAADGFASQPVLQMLEFVAGELRLDPLVASAIERGTRARHQVV